MQHLFSVWQDIARRLRAARRVLLLFDYDGTLTPIVASPELAELPEGTRVLLRTLNDQQRFSVGVISGRSLSDLKQKIGIKGLIYAGNHGLEIEGTNVAHINPVAQEMRPVLNIIYRSLGKALASVRGVLVEDKGLTLSVHYRAVQEDSHEEVKSIFERIVGTARSLGKIRVTSGKRVYEVRPEVDWDKGKAIALLLERYGKLRGNEELLPLFLGDDLTDEDGFRAVEKHGGISIFVGEEIRDTAARYHLHSPQEVERLLNLILSDILQERHRSTS